MRVSPGRRLAVKLALSLLQVKLKALAKFAGTHGEVFHFIEA